MKVTIDVPDDLYRRVKARSALLGRPVREVTIDLYRRWLGDTPVKKAAGSTESWLDEWIALGDTFLRDAPASPSAKEVLAADRARLDAR